MLICYCNVICSIVKKIENYALNGFKHCRVVGDVLLLDSGLTYLLIYFIRLKHPMMYIVVHCTSTVSLFPCLAEGCMQSKSA